MSQMWLWVAALSHLETSIAQLEKGNIQVAMVHDPGWNFAAPAENKAGKQRADKA